MNVIRFDRPKTVNEDQQKKCDIKILKISFVIAVITDIGLTFFSTTLVFAFPNIFKKIYKSHSTSIKILAFVLARMTSLGIVFIGSIPYINNLLSKKDESLKDESLKTSNKQQIDTTNKVVEDKDIAKRNPEEDTTVPKPEVFTKNVVRQNPLPMQKVTHCLPAHLSEKLNRIFQTATEECFSYHKKHEKWKIKPSLIAKELLGRLGSLFKISKSPLQKLLENYTEFIQDDQFDFFKMLRYANINFSKKLRPLIIDNTPSFESLFNYNKRIFKYNLLALPVLRYLETHSIEGLTKMIPSFANDIEKDQDELRKLFLLGVNEGNCEGKWFPFACYILDINLK